MTTMQGSRQSYDVVVVGGGQAGLAIGYFLKRQERDFVILDAAVSIGSAWAARWDSLVLFTPRRYDGLPGLAFPGDPDGYPTRDEVVAYLEQYARQLALPVELQSTVRSLRKEDDGFTLELDGRTMPPTRSSWPPARSRHRASRRSPTRSHPTSSRRTAPITGARATCLPERCSSSAAA